MKILNLIALSASILLISSASALEITVDNKTDAKAAFAFSYLDKKSGKWMTEGWFNAPQNSEKKLSLPADNPIYYIYAEFSNGKRIEGGEGAVDLVVSNRSKRWKSFSRIICNSSIDIESERTENGKVHRKVRL